MIERSLINCAHFHGSNVAVTPAAASTELTNDWMICSRSTVDVEVISTPIACLASSQSTRRPCSASFDRVTLATPLLGRQRHATKGLPRRNVSSRWRCFMELQPCRPLRQRVEGSVQSIYENARSHRCSGSTTSTRLASRLDTGGNIRHTGSGRAPRDSRSSALPRMRTGMRPFGDNTKRLAEPGCISSRIRRPISSSRILESCPKPWPLSITSDSGIGTTIAASQTKRVRRSTTERKQS